MLLILLHARAIYYHTFVFSRLKLPSDVYRIFPPSLSFFSLEFYIFPNSSFATESFFLPVTMSKVAVTHFLDYFFPFISPLWAFLSYTVCLQSIHFVYFDANVLCYEDIFVWFLFLSSRTASPNNKWLMNIDYYWKAIGLYFLFTAKIITRRKPLVNLDPVFIRFFY